MAEFSVTLSELKSKADELQSLNQLFNTEVGNLEDTEGALHGMWEGEAKETFHAEFTKDVTQMHNFYNAIQMYVQALFTIIQQYEQAEAQNVDVAASRNY